MVHRGNSTIISCRCSFEIQMSMLESQKPLLIPTFLCNGPELQHYGYEMVTAISFKRRGLWFHRVF